MTITKVDDGLGPVHLTIDEQDIRSRGQTCPKCGIQRNLIQALFKFTDKVGTTIKDKRNSQDRRKGVLRHNKKVSTYARN